MKVWLNELKEGDIFYYIMFHDVYKCRHLGNANNMNYKMSRIKFEVIDDKEYSLNKLNKEHEVFVNQYVYDDYESAIEALKENIQKDLDSTNNSIIICKRELNDLEDKASQLKKLILKYK